MAESGAVVTSDWPGLLSRRIAAVPCRYRPKPEMRLRPLSGDENTKSIVVIRSLSKFKHLGLTIEPPVRKPRQPKSVSRNKVQAIPGNASKDSSP